MAVKETCFDQVFMSFDTKARQKRGGLTVESGDRACLRTTNHMIVPERTEYNSKAPQMRSPVSQTKKGGSGFGQGAVVCV